MNCFKVFVLTIAVMVALPSIGQESEKISKENVIVLKSTPNMGFGVSAERPLRAAFSIYNQFRESGVQMDDFEIVIWGPVLKDIVSNPELFEFITERMDDDLIVSVCAVALDKLGIKIEDLPKGFNVVANAYEHIFVLQAKGYNFIIP